MNKVEKNEGKIYKVKRHVDTSYEI